ncbi:hypothetical protein C465_02416 [Halorubrum distributum JCM 9100]|uniref:Uncharacterized protein n=3 Tax=Halorubrum distributum TaxID=29283 RepID=M0EVU8_9EURY|nr:MULTISPECIES: hypothetical protein [Halorubrum distributum group]ELZ35232.1 hypothetical protein C473_04679 [Halorubrum terrestre JCM 10247]ELZ51926.1 hypothetical protein C465_02416 [Halorubrum distributum JCM 9100]ELZ52109.1 hypothetical protein C466_12703 [Halorubrum distributum JCM 10118]
MADGSGPSVAARDDLAGVVDLFEWLTRAELSNALSELAFKQRAEVDEDAIDAAIDLAVAEYALVPAPSGALTGDAPADDGAAADGEADPTAESTALAVGPAAFPTLPEGAEDLPHILDVPERGVDREPLADAVLDRLREEAVEAINGGDDDRLETLADVTYDVEAWAPVDVDPIRTRILAEVDE